MFLDVSGVADFAGVGDGVDDPWLVVPVPLVLVDVEPLVPVAPALVPDASLVPVVPVVAFVSLPVVPVVAFVSVVPLVPVVVSPFERSVSVECVGTGISTEPVGGSVVELVFGSVVREPARSVAPDEFGFESTLVPVPDCVWVVPPGDGTAGPVAGDCASTGATESPRTTALVETNERIFTAVSSSFGVGRSPLRLHGTCPQVSASKWMGRR